MRDAVAFSIKCVELIDALVRRQRGAPARPAGAAPDVLRGATFIELGPGMDLGIGLCLCGLGARAWAVDQYLCAWDPALHPAIYTELARDAQQRWPGFDARPLLECVRRGAHEAPEFSPVAAALEDTMEIPAGSVDVTYSNATLEHVVDADATAGALARLTRGGGIGLHQTDFRDHRTFDRPLEFLTLSDAEFLAMATAERWTCGNRVRPDEWLAILQRHGFDATIDVNLRADPAYLAEVRPRLLARYAALPDAALGAIGGRLLLRRR